MVAIRKRISAEIENPVASSPPVGTGAASIQDAPVAAPVPTDDREALRKRLTELEAAERNAAQLRQQQAEIRAQMLREQPPPEAPRFSERDLAFIGARPGIERDPRMAHMVNGLEGAGIAYGTERFYQMMEAAFPLSDYRRVEPEPKPVAPAAPAAPAPVAPAPVSNGNASNVYAKPDSNIDALMLAESRRMESDPAREPVHHTNAAIVSAPVSRESFSYSTGRPTQSRVVLSRDERDLARSCGVSESEWARGKLKMEARRRAGLLQGEDDR
jgi:hypothetical protein